VSAVSAAAHCPSAVRDAAVALRQAGWSAIQGLRSLASCTRRSGPWLAIGLQLDAHQASAEAISALSRNPGTPCRGGRPARSIPDGGTRTCIHNLRDLRASRGRGRE